MSKDKASNRAIRTAAHEARERALREAMEIADELAWSHHEETALLYKSRIKDLTYNGGKK